jgi:mono/diheme cytochrome c family protein
MMPRQMALLFICAAFLLVTPPLANADAPPTPRPTRLPTPLPGGGMVPAWMTPPVPGSTQAEAGAVVYYYRCMACHGDRGQGLTVEWRAQWDVEHQNCARSGCHGARHPPEGFTFPKNFAPALVGDNTLSRYENAQSLFDFISARMPYQSPGALAQDEYWQLVAFLLSRRGIHAPRVDESNAKGVFLHASPPPPGAPLALFFGSILIAGTVVAGLVLRRTKRRGRARI